MEEVVRTDRVEAHVTEVDRIQHVRLNRRGRVAADPLDATESEFSFRSRRVICGVSTGQLQWSRNHPVPTPTSRWRAPT